MSVWTSIWALVILYAVISFTYMSLKILYKGIAELKEMFTLLNEQKR